MLSAIKTIQSHFPNLDSISFNNLWQCTHELKALCSISKACHQLELHDKAKISEIIQKLALLDYNFDSSAPNVEFSQRGFKSTFQLIEAAKAAYDHGSVLICDDQSLWQHLQYAVMDHSHQLGHDFDFLNLTANSIEWHKIATTLTLFTPQIRLGLHHVLAFKPEQVVLCLKHNQIKPLQSQRLFTKSTWQALKICEIDLLTSLETWAQSADLNILAYWQNTTFAHPLVKDKLIAVPLPKVKNFEKSAKANPPLASRPLSISATGFNQLMQDPYGYYARYILKLTPAKPSKTNSFAQEFGIAVHELVALYLLQGKINTQQYIANLELSHPKILWHGRILRIFAWIQEQITELKPLKIEAEKELQTQLAGKILLKARIDSHLYLEAGNLVVNFKTGTPPQKIAVISGYAPQLIVELFLAQNDNPHQVAQGEFWQLKGTQPSGIVTTNLAMPLKLMRENLEKITSHYLLGENPFLACPWPLKKPKYNEYAYLERLTHE